MRDPFKSVVEKYNKAIEAMRRKGVDIVSEFLHRYAFNAQETRRDIYDDLVRKHPDLDVDTLIRPYWCPESSI